MTDPQTFGGASSEPADMARFAWDALASEPGTGVSISNLDGRLLWCNDEFARIIHGESRRAADIIGRTWTEQGLPPDWIAERMAIAKRISEDAKPVLVRTIWRGYQQFSWAYPIPGEAGTPVRFLAITRRIPGKLDAAGVDILESQVARLGDLDVLSGRELEVLALIGRGLSNKEISRALERSEKTVDNHRQAIARKLHATGRIQLAEVARQAGLEVEDRERKRV